MRSLEELLSDEPAWPMVQSWIADAMNDVRSLPVERSEGERTLELLQVTTHAPLGALALETGGVLADHGWLRLLGSDGSELKRGLASWNGLEEPARLIENALVVAHDAVGGFFALNGGAFVGELGHVFYFAPDTLDWLDIEMGYTDFVQWVCAGDLARFYAELRWPGWEAEVSTAPPDDGFHLYPPPFRTGGEADRKGEAAAGTDDRAVGVVSGVCTATGRPTGRRGFPRRRDGLLDGTGRKAFRLRQCCSMTPDDPQ